MRHPRFYFLAAMLFAALLAVPVLVRGGAIAQGKDKLAAPNVNWEYKVVSPAGGHSQGHVDIAKMEEALNNLGKDGWECVGTVSEVLGGGARNWTNAVLICKRPKQ